MSEHRIHIFGASGAGTTTLGRALAKTLSVVHFDADDYYWEPTPEPFTVKRPPDVRIRMLERDMAKTSSWVLSGSVVSWGDSFIPRFTLAVFITLSRDVRLARLRQREKERYGARVEPGGDWYEHSQAFLDWAYGYDEPGGVGRSRQVHEAWLKRLSCPILRIESVKPTSALVSDVMSQLVS